MIPGILGLVGLLLPFVDTRKDKMRYMELPSEHPVRTSVILALLVFFLMTTLAGYKIDFQQQGSILGNNAVLWTLVLGGPLLTYIVSYTLLRIFYGKKEEEALQ